VSWEVASYLLLFVALAVGFAWYERSHPSARVLALVGTLAALAVLGRIAFAPIPNVKPTTDIVLLAGYVFGGAPGFAVGAVAALASNLFFTQGPWTPWQMAAWGTIGVAGAGLATVSRGRLRRLPLALACGAAGLLYGVVVNFGTVVTFAGSGDLWHRYLVYQGTSLPWDLAHAVGNVVFFLVFGPALVQTLRRFRTRLSFTWHPHPAGLAVALAGVLLMAGAT
jgi:energy-coupling factor transport system substrate-specific component